MRIESQPAFILHSRAYRDSSLIIEFLSRDFGRVSGVLKGVRGTGRSARQRRSVAQPFVPLMIGWSGNTDLKQVIQCEATAAPIALAGERLFSGFYANELLTRLLHPLDENAFWYALYERVLRGLASSQPADVILRHFELGLLQELGYGIDFSADSRSGAPISADACYVFDPGEGLTAVAGDAGLAPAALFPGADLLAIAAGHFDDAARRSAKRLCRLALAEHLGSRPLKSRELFVSRGGEDQ